MKPFFTTYSHLCWQAAQQWLEDKAPQLSAALAFYSLLSLGPLFLIAISIAGLFFGREAASGQIVGQIEGLVGKPGAIAIQAVIAGSQQPSSNIIGAIVGVVTLLLGASGVFGQLQEALNIIWKTPDKMPGGFWFTVKKRLLSFAMVLGVGFLLLVSLILTAVLAALGTYFIGVLPSAAPFLQLLNTALTFGLATVLFAMIFKILPDAHINWRNVWGGAAFSAALFTLGKYLIGFYLGSSAISSTYGAAGSFVILALWVYYSGLILFFGAELTFVYSEWKRDGRL